MLIAFIVVAEIAFWSILFSGLAARYVLRRPRLGMALLVATPVVDLALFAATTIDLRRGGEAALPHALAVRAPIRRRAAARAASPLVAANTQPARAASGSAT